MKPEPYFDEFGIPRLEQSIVVVTDILGYSDMTREALRDGSQQSLLIRIYEALDKSLKNVKDPSGSKWFTKLYSDNLIVGLPFIPESGTGSFEMLQACYTISHFQREMFTHGFFLRGGISFGSIHASENLIFGEVLEELKKAEPNANNPRIVLLDSVIEFLRNNPEIANYPLLNDILLTDIDGRKFIDYLHGFSKKTSEPRRKIILTHKQLIEQNIEKYRSDSTILSKYKWLADYHNRFCQNSSTYNTEKYLVVASFSDD